MVAPGGNWLPVGWLLKGDIWVGVAGLILDGDDKAEHEEDVGAAPVLFSCFRRFIRLGGSWYHAAWFLLGLPEKVCMSGLHFGWSELGR